MGKLSRLANKVQSQCTIFILRRRSTGIHPSVRFVGHPFVQLARGSVLDIGAGTSIVSVGSRTALGLDHPVNLRVIGEGAKLTIGRNVGISGGDICARTQITIGEGTLIGANVVICDTDFHPLDSHHRAGKPVPEPLPMDRVQIGKNVFIGTRAIILKGSTIGDNSVIGAGAVVKGNFPSGVTIAGNPARVIRSISFADAPDL